MFLAIRALKIANIPRSVVDSSALSTEL